MLQQGTELIVSADGSIAGLLGASPGASTAVPIMIDLLKRSFPDQWNSSWSKAISEAIPGYAADTNWNIEAVTASVTATSAALEL